MCYRGSQSNPTWIDTDPGACSSLFIPLLFNSQTSQSANFTILCQLEADLSQIPKTANRNPAGNMYYTIRYGLVLIFGLTEIQAQLQWLEDVRAPESSENIILTGSREWSAGKIDPEHHS